jgi:heme A synthase
MFVEVGVGAAQVLLGLPEALRALHLALASLLWSGTAVLAAAAWLDGRAGRESRPVGARALARAAGGR